MEIRLDHSLFHHMFGMTGSFVQLFESLKHCAMVLDSFVPIRRFCKSKDACSIKQMWSNIELAKLMVRLSEYADFTEFPANYANEFYKQMDHIGKDLATLVKELTGYN